MEMKEHNLSEIEIVPVKPRSGLVAFTSFILDDHFYVGDVAIYTRLGGGYRLVYPARNLPNGKRINTFHPINHEAGDAIEQAVVAKFEELMKMAEDTKTTD